MSGATGDTAERAREDLARLTGAECRVLYWLCKGLDPIEIAARLDRSDSAVRAQLTGIYAKFGLQDIPARNRFYALDKIYCPLHEKLVKDPDRDCRRTRKPRTKSPKTSDQWVDGGNSGVPQSTGDEGVNAGEDSQEEPTAPPDPRILAIVRKDEAQGIIPLLRTTVLRQQDMVPIPPRQGEKPVSERPSLLYLLVGLVGVLIGAVLLYAIMSGRPGQPVITAPTPANQQPSQQNQPSGGARPSATAVPAAMSNVQSPAPGSVIAAGQAFTRGGVTVAARRQLEIDSGFIGVSFDIHNGSSNQIIVRWKPSLFHLEDDQGRIYRQRYEESVGLNQVFQFSLAPSASQAISAWMNGYGDHSYGIWVGQIDPKARYLIFRVDDIAGLTNLTWRFDF